MKWPQILTTTIAALIPKESSQAEAELRPIGLTPIIYRVWMCVRKHCISKWIEQLYGSRILSAVDHAWNTRVEQELARHTKGFFSVLCTWTAPNVMNVFRTSKQLPLQARRDAQHQSVTWFSDFMQDKGTQAFTPPFLSRVAEIRGSLLDVDLLFTF